MPKNKTGIGYVDYTINPYKWRCQKVSPGCKNCYMMALARRYGQDPTGPFETRWPAALKELATLPAGTTVFLNDMSDTYLDAASDDDVIAVHNMAVQRPDLYMMIVTKRPQRALDMADRLAWPDNLWLVVSVENNDYRGRIDAALATNAAHVGVSAEPLLGPLDLMNYMLPGRRIEWVIAGGESGPNRRALDKTWPFELMVSCLAWGVPFFYKQGGAFKPGEDRLLDGREWNEIPVAFGGSGIHDRL